MKLYGTTFHIFRLICLLLTTGVIVVFWRDTVLVTALSILFAVLANYASTKKDIIVFFTVATLATILESIAMSSGAWVYEHKHVFNFPIWLPLYWGIGGLVIQDVYRLIERYIKE